MATPFLPGPAPAFVREPKRSLREPNDVMRPLAAEPSPPLTAALEGGRRAESDSDEKRGIEGRPMPPGERGGGVEP
jgi:hypothetical protein